MNELTRNYNLKELEEIRETILSKVNKALILLNEATEQGKKISEYAVYFGRMPDLDIEKIEDQLDSSLWDYVIEVTGILRFMTASKVKEVKEHIKTKKLIYSYENAAEITTWLQENAKNVIGSTVQEVFKEFTNVFFRKSGSRRSERRNTVQIEKTFRMSIGSLDSMRYRHDGELQKINDLEFVCDILKGKPRKDYPHRINDKITDAIQKNEILGREICSEHFALRVYKNGNVRICFLTDVYVLLNKYGADGSEISFNKDKTTGA
jgi:hypothetical protein